MLIKKQANLTPKIISRWLTVITILLIMVILILVSNFLYENFYQTVTQTKKIVIPESSVATYAVNMKKFNLIMDKLTKKTEPKELGNVVSPFR